MLDGNLTFTDGATITPSDTANLEPTPRGVSCDVAGVISVVTLKGNIFTFTALAGTVYPIAVQKIRSTATTATGLKAWYV